MYGFERLQNYITEAKHSILIFIARKYGSWRESGLAGKSFKNVVVTYYEKSKVSPVRVDMLTR